VVAVGTPKSIGAVSVDAVKPNLSAPAPFGSGRAIHRGNAVCLGFVLVPFKERVPDQITVKVVAARWAVAWLIHDANHRIKSTSSATATTRTSIAVEIS
jgi:hypothetical protein